MDVVAMYRKGMALKQIAKIARTRISTIRAKVVAAGLPITRLNGRTKISPKMRIRCGKLALKGLSYRAIAKRLELPEHSVYRCVKRQFPRLLKMKKPDAILDGQGNRLCSECHKWAPLPEFRVGVRNTRSFCARCHRFRKRSKLYGITPEQYEAKLVAQGFSCAICLRPHTPSKKYPDLCVDHDHTTGKVRGLLCWVCNLVLGNVKDSVQLLNRAAKYLQKHRKP